MEAAAMLEELAAAWACMAEVVEDAKSSFPMFVDRFRLHALIILTVHSFHSKSAGKTSRTSSVKLVSLQHHAPLVSF